LGDGRAILVGEQVSPKGESFDLHLKGAGQTPFSRRGDGRAALGPMLREFLVSEAMHALGIPTTRSLAVATTGEMIPRDGLKRGAVLVRTAASHIRVGTFEYAGALGDRAMLASLADHAIARHDPDLSEEPDRAARFLARVIERQARTIARWQSVGFVHGVMNTDNMAVSGETIDYGPCAFIDAFDPESVFSSIDRHGRYRYSQQPAIAQWNLARLAESLLPLIIAHEGDEARAVDRANELLGAFSAEYGRAWLGLFRAKIGLAREEADDGLLVRDLLAWMHAEKADFTNTFRALAEQTLAPNASRADWDARWQARLARESDAGRSAPARMRATNPAVTARNHRVEEALAAAESGDLAPFEALVAALRRPFAPIAADAPFREPPPSDFCGYRTFCGT
ncbi:MAG: protein adenylyltransferase SelO, partial [bacterium]